MGDGVLTGQLVGDLLQLVDALGQPAGEVDAAACDVVEREGRGEEAFGVVGDRGAREDPVEAEAPGVLEVGVQTVVLAVVLVEGPTDAGVLDPARDGLQVVLGEAEPAADGIACEQVQDAAALGPAAGDGQHLGDDGEQRVGLGERAVGEHHANWWPGWWRSDSSTIAPIPKAAVIKGA